MKKHEFSQGVCEDGAAILCDGEMMSIESILFKLHEGQNYQSLYEMELRERMEVFIKTLSMMTNGEWDQLKKMSPTLHRHIKQAVNR